MTIFLTGCTHFGHEKIVRLAKRPFSSLQEMEETLIENWNKTVSANDTVYHHGDFAYKASGDIKKKYLSRLNGNIILIQGNHDPRNWGKDIVQINHKFEGKDRKVVMCHYPIEEWNGWFHGSVHFHCHTHKPEFKSAERRGNVGVDSTNFTPIALDDAIKKVL